MKKIIFTLVLFPIFVLAQSSGENWVKTKTYKQPTVSAIATPSVSQATTQVTYFDGLGRPIQQVAHGQSSTGKDIVTHIEYDAFGRQTKEFLPYASENTSLDYNTSASTAVFNFHTSYNGGTQNPYSEKLLEASPLGRMLKQAAPGDAWAMGSGKEIKFDYQTNASEEVRHYFAKTEWNDMSNCYDIQLTLYDYYAPNMLYLTITYNEDAPGEFNKKGRIDEYKDKEGKVVLKRSYNGEEVFDTYYAYDVFGNLTFVLPPLVVESNPSQDVLDGLCYQYKYDNRNRLVEKKLPGKQWEYMVYDKLDRVVATGPAYSPWGGSDTDKGWMLTKYDVFNRPVYTGWYNGIQASTSTDRKSLQGMVNANELLSESKTTSTFTIDGVATKYTNSISPTSFKLLTVTYYDNYDYPNAPTLPSLIEEQNTQTTNLKGLATGTWIRVLDNASATTNETSYTLYDQRYRPIRSYTKNYLGGYTQIDSKLDWSGKTVYTVTKHKRLSTSLEIMTKDVLEYSNQDRIVLHKHQLNTDPFQLLALNSYDELGQLISKKIGNTDVTGDLALQTVDYSYNSRGWLKSINDVNHLESDLFAFKLSYDQPVDGVQGLYNGNISETYWKTSSDNVLRKYEYQYDDLNRLLVANYNKPEVPTATNNYREAQTYDKNGNILSLERYGSLDPNGGLPSNLIDQLVYTYSDVSPNVLQKVNDQSNSPEGFKDGTNDEADYVYDGNGNMIKDMNKDIETILYNHLNLPTKIIFQGTTSGSISYLYNAAGQKLSKQVTYESLGLSVVTDYLSGFQYQNEVLQFFPHAEGYVKYTPPAGRGSGVYTYVFNYTDHLGNIRLSYGKDPSTNVLKVLEENHYYPFGLKHTNYNSDKMTVMKEQELYKIKPTSAELLTYKYKYNGKEFQDELGLNMYDYGARNYDPALGRFLSHDPYSAKYSGISPYSYCYNSPVLFIDPFGMWITINDGSNTYRYYNGTTQHVVDGNWVDIDENVKLSGFVLMTIASLHHLENGGVEGKKLIDHFSNDENNAEINYEKGTAGEANDSGCIPFDHRAGSEATTTTTKSGMQDSPLFVTIAHELGHLKDPENDRYTVYDNWMGRSRGEIYASHVENLIRAEHDLALRVSYIVKIKNKIYPGLDVSTVLIDCSGNSLYYKPNGELYKWKSRDGDSKDIAKAYNSLTGRDASNVLTGRFNYYENAKKNKK